MVSQVCWPPEWKPWVNTRVFIERIMQELLFRQDGLSLSNALPSSQFPPISPRGQSQVFFVSQSRESMDLILKFLSCAQRDSPGVKQGWKFISVWISEIFKTRNSGQWFASFFFVNGGTGLWWPAEPNCFGSCGQAQLLLPLSGTESATKLATRLAVCDVTGKGKQEILEEKAI